MPDYLNFMDMKQTPRILTHDERKAAEAAFSGRPCNPVWSESAKKVYAGLVRALPTPIDESTVAPGEQLDEEREAVTPIVSLSGEGEPQAEEALQGGKVSKEKLDHLLNQVMTTRHEAIQAGVLIDVTADAQKLGMSFPITITKPLWEVGIAPDQTLSDETKASRLRDVLMAFRLRLASQATLSPLIDFPAMLALPPGGVPQPVPLFALIQPGEQNQAMVTLLLPNEVSASIIPMN
ncbi:hypothetical protein YTPLAS72_02920 [Nitrospira sp.]|nr:hypothetical protein YTPLAS72_02920 [Nitrospira sp.]